MEEKSILEQVERKIYTLAEIARMFSCNKDTVKRWIKEGRIESLKIGREYRVTLPALEKAVARFTLEVKTNKNTKA